MRVVHISKVTGIAGSEGHLLNLLPGLAARGVDVRMWVLVEPRRPVPEYMARWREAGIDSAALPIYLDLDPTLVVRLTRRLRQLRPDIVHTHLIHADTHGPPSARLAGVKAVISTRHNDDPFRRRFPIRGLTRVLDGLTDHYVAISEWVRAYTVEREGVAPEKVTTIRYGLPPASGPESLNGLRDSLSVPSDAPLVGVVARLVAQKGHIYLLEAFRRVLADLPAARLLVVGDGPLRAELEAQAAALGIEESVNFTGWRDDADRLIAALDVLAMPSLWEGFGLVALEAMARAKPIVATRVSALPEVVVDGPEGTGWLVPPRDAEALAGALLEALRQPDAAQTHGQRGYQRLLDHFSPQRMADQTLAVYERVLSEKAAA